ncbi:hypothetical protein [Rhizobium leguminosarum]|uniref:hypothetical protein n=1 Tax=Rhizobium leguminosarum TaxID=384 RepID=UPI00144226C8|nr:hypothetical protein [Rhizobium leguminosarum]
MDSLVTSVRDAMIGGRWNCGQKHGKNLTLAVLKPHNSEQLRQIERQMIAIEKEIMLIIKDDPDLAERFDIIVSIPGVSVVTAFALLIDMPELGTLDQGQAALLTGLDPSHGSPGHGPAVPSGRSDIRSWSALTFSIPLPEIERHYDTG